MVDSVPKPKTWRFNDYGELVQGDEPRTVFDAIERLNELEEYRFGVIQNAQDILTFHQGLEAEKTEADDRIVAIKQIAAKVGFAVSLMDDPVFADLMRTWPTFSSGQKAAVLNLLPISRNPRMN
ncbi:hypothetical protein [Lacunimicrobium album]